MSPPPLQGCVDIQVPMTTKDSYTDYGLQSVSYTACSKILLLPRCNNNCMHQIQLCLTSFTLLNVFYFHSSQCVYRQTCSEFGKLHSMNPTFNSIRIHGIKYRTKCYLVVPSFLQDSERSKLQNLGYMCFSLLTQHSDKSRWHGKTMSCRQPLSVPRADICNKIEHIPMRSWKTSQHTFARDHHQSTGVNPQD